MHESGRGSGVQPDAHRDYHHSPAAGWFGQRGGKADVRVSRASRLRYNAGLSSCPSFVPLPYIAHRASHACSIDDNHPAKRHSLPKSDSEIHMPPILGEKHMQFTR